MKDLLVFLSPPYALIHHLRICYTHLRVKTPLENISAAYTFHIQPASAPQDLRKKLLNFIHPRSDTLNEKKKQKSFQNILRMEQQESDVKNEKKIRKNLFSFLIVVILVRLTVVDFKAVYCLFREFFSVHVDLHLVVRLCQCYFQFLVRF